MSAEPGLRLVNEATGEFVPFTDGDTAQLQQEIARLNDVVRGLQRDVRGWAHRYAELKRDREADAKKDPLWPDAVRLFKLWRRLCGHPRAGWDADRFEQVRPYLKQHGLAMCERAIAGAAFDAFTTTRKNGSKKKHDGWELIHRNADKWEEFACRAPTPFVSELEAEDEVAAREAADVVAARDAARTGQASL